MPIEFSISKGLSDYYFNNWKCERLAPNFPVNKNHLAGSYENKAGSWLLYKQLDRSYIVVGNNQFGEVKLRPAEAAFENIAFDSNL